MYRIAFLKQKAGVLREQEIYKMNCGSIGASTESYGSSDSSEASDCPVLQLPEDLKNDVNDICLRGPQSFLSIDSDISEDNEYSKYLQFSIVSILYHFSARIINTEIGRLTLQDRKILKETFKMLEHRPIRCGLNIMIK